MKRLLALFAALTFVAACSVDNSPDSSPIAVTTAAYRASDPPSITLFTMINNRTGEGGHSALMVNASQRVIFDPAGSFRDERVVERGDVLYGITPGWLQAYKSAHARSTFHVVAQEIPLTNAQAEQALRLVQANGSVGGGFCAQSTSSILAQIEGLENTQRTFFPVKLMDQIAKHPNVITTKLYENDDGDIVAGVRAAVQSQE
ncbi:hypothetical protein [Sulfitobacter sediminilitoris]|uniref:hypothetical protein n=1 Tax=Sulfitobacter sediminilitoris TaxID=2698830 RepID=UPI002E2AD80F|nr:hypothetical protein [Sulfitobacter sediminilitoris]